MLTGQVALQHASSTYKNNPRLDSRSGLLACSAYNHSLLNVTDRNDL